MTTIEANRGAEGKPYTPGRNAVEIKPLGGRGGYYRTYEIYQRWRLKDSQHEFNPRWFLRKEYLLDPYPYLNKLRELYEFYRDWINNCDWTTRYNDVTSIFVDDYNFETRPKLWFYGMEGYGRDLRDELPVLFAWANGVEGAADAIIDELLGAFVSRGEADLVGDYAFPLPLRLLASALGLPRPQWQRFGELYRAMQEGVEWDPVREVAGKAAIAELTEMLRPLLEQRRRDGGTDMIGAIASLDLADGPARAEDIVTTLLEGDGDTLFGGLANTLCNLLRHPEQLEAVRGDHLLAKRAWQEGVRLNAPALQTRRFALHEVERFGRLIPEGGLVMCSAAAANRDPRQFSNPDSFDLFRKDLCYREPRGHYRADGLPAAVVFGLGKPSKHPAVPEDRPRSEYAITMDLATRAIERLLDATKDLRLAPGAEPTMFCRWPWDIHVCWDLPVVFGH